MMSKVVFPCSMVALRQQPGAVRRIAGLGAPYEVYARIRREGVKEKVRRGAFTRTLAEVQDGRRNVDLLVDHDSSKLLAKTRNGSLTLRESDRGLEFEATLPDTTLGRDIQQMSDDGLLSGVSMSFTGRGKSTRIGKQIDLSDDEIPMMRPSPDTGALEGSSWIEGVNRDDASRWRVLTEVDLTELSVITGGDPVYTTTTVTSRADGLANWIRIYEII